MADSALSGLVVLDLSENISGLYCTKLLADYGAEVVKIENPQTGDAGRRVGPFPNDEPNIEKIFFRNLVPSPKFFKSWF